MDGVDFNASKTIEALGLAAYLSAFAFVSLPHLQRDLLGLFTISIASLVSNFPHISSIGA